MIVGLIKIVLVLICILLSVAFMTVAERKYLSSIQRRRGPNVIGFYGLLQAIGDGLKLIVKETTKPVSADKILYISAPIFTFMVSLSCWGVIPLNEGLVLGDINIGVLYILAISSLGVYGVLIGGYSSNSKYGFYGGIRSSAQMISYEVSLAFIVGIFVLYSGGTLNLSDIVLTQEKMWHMVGLFPVLVLFVITVIAETNRHPFDLPEAESELVSGYNVEYSAGGFALYFLGEYSSIILMSALTGIFFMGGWLWVISFSLIGPIVGGVKIFILINVFIWARGAFPRYRYDQLLDLGWRSIFPLVLSLLILLMGNYLY